MVDLRAMLPRLRALYATEPLLCAAGALLGVAALAAIWGARQLAVPGSGLPQPAPFSLAPPAGYLLPVYVLSRALPLAVAHRLYLSVYAIALPLGALGLARQMGRSPWLTLFTFPLIFNLPLGLGE